MHAGSGLHPLDGRAPKCKHSALVPMHYCSAATQCAHQVPKEAVSLCLKAADGAVYFVWVCSVPLGRNKRVLEDTGGDGNRGWAWCNVDDSRREGIDVHVSRVLEAYAEFGYLHAIQVRGRAGRI